MAKHPLGQLYHMYALSPLIDIAHYVSHDFIARPHLFRGVSDATAVILGDFRFKTGQHPKWPDPYQRTLNFKIINHVNLAGPGLRAAAMACCQDGAADSKSRQLKAYKEATDTFRGQLADLDGPSLASNCSQIQSIFSSAVAVLQDKGVAAAYGLPPAPADGWPLAATPNVAASTLVEEVMFSAKRIACLAGSFRRVSRSNPQERSLFPDLSVVVTRSKFANLQQAGYFGGIAISESLSRNSKLKSADLADAAYNWTLALQRLLPDPVRAWRDLDYRSKLTDLEWGLAPSPVGDATPEALGSSDPVAFQTNTVNGEICCSSGDLDCDPTAIQTDFCSEFCGGTIVA